MAATISMQCFTASHRHWTSRTGNGFRGFHSARPHLIRAVKEADSQENESSTTVSDTSTPAESKLLAVEAKFRSRRRKKRDELPADAKPVDDLPSREIKPWENMSVTEKAWEVYVGERGLLFWLNKLAYASIFAIAGGWIVFRFVGPALGWYELDSPLMAPEKLFTGSPS